MVHLDGRSLCRRVVHSTSRVPGRTSTEGAIGMAPLIHLTRTAEDETSVSDRYGPTPDAHPDQVTSLKETGEVTEAEDGGLVAG